MVIIQLKNDEEGKGYLGIDFIDQTTESEDITQAWTHVEDTSESSVAFTEDTEKYITFGEQFAGVINSIELFSHDGSVDIDKEAAISNKFDIYLC